MMRNSKSVKDWARMLSMAAETWAAALWAAMATVTAGLDTWGLRDTQGDVRGGAGAGCEGGSAEWRAKIFARRKSGNYWVSC